MRITLNNYMYNNIYSLPSPKSLHYLNRYIKFISIIDASSNITQYKESHHILPEAMGGVNDNTNLIDLTPRQHYIAHWILWKAYKSKEMTAAFFSMCNQNNQYQHRKHRINSKVYEKLKIEFSKEISISTKELWTNQKYRDKHNLTNQSAYTKNLRSEKAKKLWQDDEYRRKLTLSRKLAWAEGRVNRDHSKCGVTGELNPAKRPEVKIKNSGKNHYSNREGYVKPTCPYCGITTTPTNIKRWHGNNCKLKN